MNKIKQPQFHFATTLWRGVIISASRGLVFGLALLLLATSQAAAQTTAFTYQGRLLDNGSPANGQYDFQFKLFDTATVGTGTQQGGTSTVPNVPVTAGLFIVQLDFGPVAFTGAPRFLEIAVKPTSGGVFTTLGPRQPLNSTPYAIRSLNAAAADGLSVACVSCITSSQIQSVQGSQVMGNIAGSQISGAIPVASVPAGSASYIQNTTSQQAATNFNIAGNGLIGGSLGLGTSGPSTRLQVHSTGLDQHLYLSSAAPSLALGDQETRSSATMNGLFALSTASGHFGIEAGGLMIATYGNNRGNIYIDSNYSGTGTKNVILQPFAGSVGIGITDLSEFGPKLRVDGDTSITGHLTSSSNGNTIHGITVGGIGVLGETTGSGIGVYGKSPNGQYAGYFSGDLRATGIVTINTYSAGGGASVCRNGFQEISLCSSSLRYKTAIQPFSRGFDLIKQLRPITFTWKQDGLRDLGFGAEDVEKIEPLLVTYNPKGEVEGVKYDRITVALVNAAREQQAQIDQQRKQIKQQRQEIETLKRRQEEFAALKRLVCADHPHAEVCKTH